MRAKLSRWEDRETNRLFPRKRCEKCSVRNECEIRGINDREKCPQFRGYLSEYAVSRYLGDSKFRGRNESTASFNLPVKFSSTSIRTSNKSSVDL